MNAQLFDQIMTSLKRQGGYQEGWAYGILDCLVAKRSDVREYELKPQTQILDLVGVQPPLPSNPEFVDTETLSLYHEGYAAAIAYALRYYSIDSIDEHSPVKIPGTDYCGHIFSLLQGQNIFIGGRMAGSLFAIESRGDLALLHHELSERREDLLTRITGPMSLNAGPRIWKEGYMIGLSEAVEIVTRLTRGEDPQVPNRSDYTDSKEG